MTQTIDIDIWSDIQCPWCYIGKRRLETAISEVTEANPDLHFAIAYHSFELSPDTPVDFDGTPLDYLMERKNLNSDQVLAMFDQVTTVAAAEGLEYHLTDAHQINTRKAHELLHFAAEKGKQVQLKEALMLAYFTKSQNLGDQEVLADIAASVGLERQEALAALTAKTYAEAVTADEVTAQRLGITGVPFFIIGGKYGISGAQPSEVFTQALTRVADEQAAS